MARLDKRTLQTLGFVLIIIGLLLLLITLLPNSVMNCPANGCPPVSPLWYWVGVFILLSGIAFVILGIILFIVARRMKPEKALKE